jgi:hypothetical protein
MGMSYFYDGEFCFSRTISEAEAEEVLDVLRFEPVVVYEVECNTLRLITSGEAYSGRNEELRDLEEWCEKRGLHLVEGSYLHYTGDSAIALITASLFRKAHTDCNTVETKVAK